MTNKQLKEKIEEILWMNHIWDRDGCDYDTEKIGDEIISLTKEYALSVNKPQKRAWNKKNARARTMVFKAVKSGRLKREPCEECGDENVQAHHDNYDKPLNVIWLCSKHHVLRDRTKRMEYKGKKYTYKELAKIGGINESALRSRVTRGWPVAEAVETGFSGNATSKRWRKAVIKS